jgi:quinolinate synthase
VDNSDLKNKILKLKEEKNALILAHYYVPLEVQDIADHVCDSFEMAKRAAAAENGLIVICGVRFMGESAKILSPD